MITKFKIFETVNEGNPKIGDYAVVNLKLKKYNNMIGVGKIFAKSYDFFCINIKLPDGRTLNDIFYEHEIKYWSKNKKELEIYIKTQKYNL